MDVLDAIGKMCEIEDVSARELSRRIGKSPNYIGVTVSKGSEVGASNLAGMARALGWQLVLRKGDVSVEISPRK